MPIYVEKIKRDVIYVFGRGVQVSVSRNLFTSNHSHVQIRQLSEGSLDHFHKLLNRAINWGFSLPFPKLLFLIEGFLDHSHKLHKAF